MLLLWKTGSHQEKMLSLSGKIKSVAETRKVMVEWLSKSSMIRKYNLGRTTVKPTQRSIHGGPRCSMALESEAVALISKDENP